MKFNEASNTL
jgi:predicted lipase